MNANCTYNFKRFTESLSKKKKKFQDFDNNARAIFTEIVTIPSLKERFYSRKANQLVRKYRDGNN